MPQQLQLNKNTTISVMKVVRTGHGSDAICTVNFDYEEHREGNRNAAPVRNPIFGLSATPRTRAPAVIYAIVFELESFDCGAI